MERLPRDGEVDCETWSLWHTCVQIASSVNPAPRYLHLPGLQEYESSSADIQQQAIHTHTQIKSQAWIVFPNGHSCSMIVDILYRTVEHSWSWLAGKYIQAENWSTRSSWMIVLRENCLTLPRRIDLRTQVSNRELCDSGSFATFSGRPEASQGKFNYAMSRRVRWTNVKREVGKFSLVVEHLALAGNEWIFPLTFVLRGISEFSN
jgi:hypothetical protein